MKSLYRKFTYWFPIVIMGSILIWSLMQLERWSLSVLSGEHLRVNLLEESPLVNMSELEGIKIDLDNPDLRVLQERVLQIPWVRDAAVRRIWPDRLQLSVKPRHPLALWDEEHILSLDGVLVPAPEEFAHLALPQVRAGKGQARLAAEKLWELEPALNELGINLNILIIEEWGEISVVTRRGQQIYFGSVALAESLQRLRKVWLDKNSKAEQRATIDLRYNNAVVLGQSLGRDMP